MTETPIAATLIGYARCSTDRQDLDVQRQVLLELGVAEDRIYSDHGLTGTTRTRPCLDQAIADQLQERDVKLAQGPDPLRPDDPMRRMFFNILATFAEFEADLIRIRTREDMAIVRTKGKLRCKQPKLSD